MCADRGAQCAALRHQSSRTSSEVALCCDVAAGGGEDRGPAVASAASKQARQPG